MQQLSNDTVSWNLIDAPLPSPLFSNSNVYGNLADASTTIPGISETPSSNYWAFALIFFPLFTIFGNVLVVVSVYREKSLHTVTNYFVVSLAISDITVAAVVMPFAIYLEFNRAWELSERLCDFWVASDCMACTASILNLVAIAVDRYIAVTKPLKYARHKNSKRVTIMIVIVWLVSFFIALPIVSGINKSDVEAYPRVPDQCAFFNNKFLIFSSLGSFFIPCILIFAIYYRIFMVIMARARQSRKQWRPRMAIQSAAEQHRTNTKHLITTFLRNQNDSQQNPLSDNNEIGRQSSPSTKALLNATEMTPSNQIELEKTALMVQISTNLPSDVIRPSVNVTSSSGDQLDDDERDDIALFVQNEQIQSISKNKNQNNNTNHHQSSEQNNQIEILPSTSLACDGICARDGLLKQNNRSSQTENHHTSPKSTKRIKTRLKNVGSRSDGVPSNNPSSLDNTVKTAKRKAYSRMKKERKATQTLIIVLICFLVCWLPFFVLNNLVNAIVRLLNRSTNLLVSDFVLSLCVWLGYINSFLNPIIYTIFNLEFRKAFAKILFSSCSSSNTT